MPTPVFLPFSWTGEPGRLQSMGSQRVGHDIETKHSTELKFPGLVELTFVCKWVGEVGCCVGYPLTSDNYRLFAFSRMTYS